MSFTYPAFLFALLAIAIPIIIHLFNFRKFKTVYFSNVRFLKEVKQQTQAKSTLKHLLVLAARILAITFLVFAFAQPFIPIDNKKIILGNKAISIFIDNSFSMDAITKNGNLLDEAKKRAIEIASAYKPSDRFQLLTNDFEGKHQRLVNKEEFIELVDEVKISAATHLISTVHLRQIDALEQSTSKSKSTFIISDFQKSITNINELKNDTGVVINFIPISASVNNNNVYIDSCWFETPVHQLNQVEKLHVRIKNSGEKKIENNSIKLFINNVQKTPAAFNVDPHAETEIILSFVSKEIGLQQCSIVLNDYPVTFDDTFYFTFDVAKNIPILCINGATPNNLKSQSIYLNKLFGNDSLFIFTNVLENKVEYSNLLNFKLIIINELKSISSGLAQELKRFMINGGNVLVFPNIQSELASYKDFLISVNSNYYEQLDTVNTKVDKINLEQPIFKDVFDRNTIKLANIDLPIIYNHYRFSNASKTTEDYLLKLQNGNNFLSKYDVGKGILYVCASSLDPSFSNFSKHALFVPVLYKIGMYSQVNDPLFYIIGNEEQIEIVHRPSGENTYHLKDLKNTFDIIPDYKLLETKTQLILHHQIKNAGNYNLYVDNNLISGLSFNYNRKESNLVCYTSDELKQLITNDNIHIISAEEKSITSILEEKTEGKKLWQICILLTLFFLGAEVLLLRLLKTN
jgi:hypothetical protein